MTNIIFDSRWINNGGIGRFCYEIMSSETIQKSQKKEGFLSQALSISDLFMSSYITVKGGYFISPGYNAPLFSCSRSIITIHDLMHLYFPGYESVKNKLYYDMVVKRAVKSAPLVFTVSEFTRQEIADWANISINKIAVIPNGVDQDFYHEDIEPIIREQPYFLYVGNNKSHKNLARLLESFAKSQLSKEVDLLFSCAPTTELSQLVTALCLSEAVVFLSGVEEDLLPRYYKGAIATVIVSLYEGFCLPILESMAVGTPVITSNITAMPEVAGGAALLADPYDIGSISDAMVNIWQNEDLRSELSLRGGIRAQAFSWDRSRTLWDNALKPILEKI